jgi:hypothetical protein
MPLSASAYTTEATATERSVTHHPRPAVDKVSSLFSEARHKRKALVAAAKRWFRKDRSFEARCVARPGRTSRLERGGKPLWIIGPDPANVAILEVQLDCVEAGDVIDAPAWSHSDSKSVQPTVAHNLGIFDVGERKAIIPKSWPEIPANLAAAHFHRQGRKEPRQRAGQIPQTATMATASIEASPRFRVTRQQERQAITPPTSSCRSAYDGNVPPCLCSPSIGTGITRYHPYTRHAGRRWPSCSS